MLIKRTNKKALAASVVVLLILLLLALVILSFYLFVYKDIAESNLNVKIVQDWVSWTAAKGKVSAHVSEQGQPPITELAEPIVINTIEELKSPETKQKIANSIYDCARAFHYGKQEFDFMGGVTKKVFCFSCQGIVFSDEIKESGVELMGLNKYMTETKPTTYNPTYAELLKQMNPSLFQTQVAPQDDILQTNNNLYIYFIGTRGISQQEFIGSIVIVSGTIAVAGLLIPGVGWVATGIAVTVGGLAQAANLIFFKDKEYRAMILIAPPELINEACLKEY